MNTEFWAAIIPLAGTVIGAGVTLGINIYKGIQNKNARLEAERKTFYLEVSQSLVLSAERMNITGQQKKEYVMTRLENECVKVGIEVNYSEMSASIERAIIIMNDHRAIEGSEDVTSVPTPTLPTLEEDMAEIKESAVDFVENSLDLVETVIEELETQPEIVPDTVSKRSRHLHK